MAGPCSGGSTPRNPAIAGTVNVNGFEIGGSNGAASISSAVRVGASQTWSNSPNSLVTISGGVNNVSSTTPYTITLAGSGTGGFSFINAIIEKFRNPRRLAWAR